VQRLFPRCQRVSWAQEPESHGADGATRVLPSPAAGQALGRRAGSSAWLRRGGDKARLGAELLARASAGLLEPADELPNPFEEAMMAVLRRRMDEGVGEAVSEVAWTAREAMFAEA
jgi:hypothetical protein